MRIINRVNVPWLIFVVLATAAACWIYLGNFYPALLPGALGLPRQLIQAPADPQRVGGTPIGLIFGAVSFAIFIFATLFGARKKVVLWRVGRVQRWMRAHIWLTLLTIPLVLLHSGFRWGGPMTALLLALYIIVMASGIYGLVLQHYLPALMKERLPAEVVFEQIPHIRRQLCRAAENLRDSLRSGFVEGERTAAPAVAFVVEPEVGKSSGRETMPPLGTQTVTESAPVPDVTVVTPPSDRESEAAILEFLDRHVLPYLRAERGERFRLNNPRFSEDTFRFLRLNVIVPYRRRVEEVQVWCDERRMLDLQTRMHHWLHGWLFIHVPFSFLLLILTGWHAFVTLFYY